MGIAKQNSNEIQRWKKGATKSGDGKKTAAIEGERMEQLCQVNTSSRLRGSLVFSLYCRHVRRLQDSNVSIANGNRSKSAFLPPAHARVNIVAQGNGFQD